MIRAAERRFNPTSMASGNLLADAHHVEFSNGSRSVVLPLSGARRLWQRCGKPKLIFSMRCDLNHSGCTSKLTSLVETCGEAFGGPADRGMGSRALGEPRKSPPPRFSAPLMWGPFFGYPLPLLGSGDWDECFDLKPTTSVVRSRSGTGLRLRFFSRQKTKGRLHFR